MRSLKVIRSVNLFRLLFVAMLVALMRYFTFIFTLGVIFRNFTVIRGCV